jgi:hypothetical protein
MLDRAYRRGACARGSFYGIADAGLMPRGYGPGRREMPRLTLRYRNVFRAFHNLTYPACNCAICATS